MQNAVDAIGADLRILFVDDEPMDVLGEQLALKRDGLAFASRVAASEVEFCHYLIDFLGCQQAQGYLLTPPTSATEARRLMGERWGARARAGTTRASRILEPRGALASARAL
jgi:hypothetical protein